MTQWRPDPTFYPSPKEAIEAPDERLAYVALLNPAGKGEPDGIGVVDLNPDSKSYGNVLHKTEFPNADNELHHFGWNACSSCLCPYAPHAHVERRYLIVPGTGSSRIHILDTKANPAAGADHDRRKERQVDRLRVRTRCALRSRRIFANALGAPMENGPHGIFSCDPETFELRRGKRNGESVLRLDGTWVRSRSPARGTPNMVKART
jgi:selenium-binding protein 1